MATDGAYGDADIVGVYGQGESLEDPASTWNSIKCSSGFGNPTPTTKAYLWCFTNSSETFAQLFCPSTSPSQHSAVVEWKTATGRSICISVEMW